MRIWNGRGKKAEKLPSTKLSCPTEAFYNTFNHNDKRGGRGKFSTNGKGKPGNIWGTYENESPGSLHHFGKAKRWRWGFVFWIYGLLFAAKMSGGERDMRRRKMISTGFSFYRLWEGEQGNN